MKAKQDTYSRLSEIIRKEGTYKQMADQLNTEGHRTPRGKRWNRQHIATWAFNHGKTGKRASQAQMATRGQMSANKKLALIKQIVMGAH